jgi:hypothetical protein
MSDERYIPAAPQPMPKKFLARTVETQTRLCDLIPGEEPMLPKMNLRAPGRIGYETYAQALVELADKLHRRAIHNGARHIDDFETRTRVEITFLNRRDKNKVGSLVALWLIPGDTPALDRVGFLASITSELCIYANERKFDIKRAVARGSEENGIAGSTVMYTLYSLDGRVLRWSNMDLQPIYKPWDLDFVMGKV